MTEVPTLIQPGLLAPQLLGDGHRDRSSAAARRASSLLVNLGHPGACPHEKVMYLIAFDNSGSMTGGNDPVGNRFAEVEYALRYLVRYCNCGREFVSLLHFDTPTSGDVPPTRLNRKGFAELTRGLAVPPDGAGISELGPSLRRITDVVAKNPDYIPVVTALSDFELFDPPQVLDAFASFPGIVHAVVFRSPPPAKLEQDDRVLVTRIPPNDEPGAVATAIMTSLTTLRRPPRRRQPLKKGMPSW